jgi:phage host-nuclease inhibitor protein Gam
MSNGFDELYRPLADLPRPEQRLDVRPRIKSIEDAELALREVAWANALQAAVLAEAERLISAINDEASRVATIEVGEETVPLANRKQALEAELLRWADANRATLCPGRKKSVDLRNGRLRWRDGKDSVKRLEDVTAKEAKEMIGDLPIGEEITIEAGPLVVGLQRILDAVGFHGAITVGVDVNKTAATAAYKLKQITAEQLDAIGHEFAAGEEYISVEPAEFVRAGV